MATTKEFRDYITDTLGRAGDITTRPMMGEYCVYYRGRLVGLICDNCLFFKQTPTAVRLLPTAEVAYPYAGSKTRMLVVDEAEDTDLMAAVLEALYSEL